MEIWYGSENSINQAWCSRIKMHLDNYLYFYSINNRNMKLNDPQLHSLYAMLL